MSYMYIHTDVHVYMLSCCCCCCCHVVVMLLLMYHKPNTLEQIHEQLSLWPLRGCVPMQCPGTGGSFTFFLSSASSPPGGSTGMTAVVDMSTMRNGAAVEDQARPSGSAAARVFSRVCSLAARQGARGPLSDYTKTQNINITPTSDIAQGGWTPHRHARHLRRTSSRAPCYSSAWAWRFAATV